MHYQLVSRKKWVATLATAALVASSFFATLTAQANDMFEQEFESPTPSGSVNGIIAYNDNDAVIVGDGGLAYVTADAGETWTDVSPGTSSDMIDIDSDDNEAMMVMLSSAYETWYTNGDGTSWNASSATPSAGPTSARDIAVPTTATWYIIGSLGTVYKTGNKGSTWASQSTGGLNSLNAVDFATTTKGAIVGDNGDIFTTTNGGTNWTTRSSGTTEDLHDVVWLSTTEVWAVGDNGTIIKSTNSGITWTTATTILGGADLYGIAERGADNIAFVGDGTAYQSFDGGATWSVYAGIFLGNTEQYLDATLPTDNTFWAVGDDGSGNMLVSKLDTEVPVISAMEIDGGSPNDDTTPQISVSASDNAGSSALTYHYYANGVLDQSIGSDEVSLNSPLSEGTHTLSVIVEDAAGNESNPSELTYVLDKSAPVVGTISPISATANEATTLSVSTSDISNLDCDLYINSALQGTMTDGGDTYTHDYTFAVAGNYTAHAECEDEVGNSTTGSSVTITVAETSTETTTETETETETSTETETTTEPEVGVSEAEEGTLIKMACGSSADVNDPCRAVYFYASDGKRHAFPNEKVYFTWYDDFDDVVIVTDTFMASISLGTNVTYHPGTKMVKFLSVNTVYAVEKGGVLRAIDSEDTATSLYGSDWNTKIDDINDAFFGNYSFGDDIDSTSDYDVDDAIASVTDLDDNF